MEVSMQDTKVNHDESREIFVEIAECLDGSWHCQKWVYDTTSASLTVVRHETHSNMVHALVWS